MKDQPNKDTMVTEVFYKPDEHGRVKVERYTQTRVDSEITLDYSEEFETSSDSAMRHLVDDLYSGLIDELTSLDERLKEAKTSSPSNPEVKESSEDPEMSGTHGRIVEIAVPEEESIPEELLTEEEKLGE